MELAFSIASFVQQANEEIYSRVRSPYVKVIVGINEPRDKTLDQAFILCQDNVVFTGLYTPWGFIKIDDGRVTNRSTEFEPRVDLLDKYILAIEKVSERCQLLKIVPACRTDLYTSSTKYLVTSFTSNADNNNVGNSNNVGNTCSYRADDKLVAKVKSSKFHTAPDLDARLPTSIRLHQEMLEFGASFYQASLFSSNTTEVQQQADNNVVVATFVTETTSPAVSRVHNLAMVTFVTDAEGASVTKPGASWYATLRSKLT